MLDKIQKSNAKLDDMKKERERLYQIREKQRLKVMEERVQIAEAFNKVKKKGKFEIPKELKAVVPELRYVMPQTLQLQL